MPQDARKRKKPRSPSRPSWLRGGDRLAVYQRSAGVRTTDRRLRALLPGRVCRRRTRANIDDLASDDLDHRRIRLCRFSPPLVSVRAEPRGQKGQRQGQELNLPKPILVHHGQTGATIMACETAPGYTSAGCVSPMGVTAPFIRLSSSRLRSEGRHAYALPRDSS